MTETPRVLVVEDEAIIGLEIRTELERAGVDVVGVVDTGNRAVELVRELHPSLVLMDINLRGGMDGIEAATRIRRISGCPIVFLTGNSDLRTHPRLLASHPSSVLMKPFSEHALREAVCGAVTSVE